MHKDLINLICNTIEYKYDLPNSHIPIARTVHSTANDKCYSVEDWEDLAKVIYNSIIHYSFNEFDLGLKDYKSMLSVALSTKLQYNHDANNDVKLKYGFYGEVLLYSILFVLYGASPLITRGYFYSPIENSETKGYDSFHLVENGADTELWFGEAKFHADHGSGIDSVMASIEKAISDKYLARNVLAIYNHKNNLNIKGSKIETIINNWELDPDIKIIEQIKKYNLKLVYPILLLYDSDKRCYDDNIKKVTEHILKKHPSKTFKLSIPYTIFFILVPLKTVKLIKMRVMEWIDTKEPLMY